MARLSFAFGHLLLTTAIMLLGTVIGQVLVMIIAHSVLGTTRSALLAIPLHAALLQDALLWLPAIASLVILLGWRRWRDRKPLPPLVRDPITGSVQGLGLGLLMWGLAVGMAISAGDIAPAAGVNSALSLVPMITLAGWLVQATTEEYIYRGWLLIKLRSRFQTPAAVLLSALIFSATHGVNPDTTLIAYLNLTLAGLWFALMTLRTGGITAAALAHTMWNWTEGSGMGLWSKGDDPQGGELLHFVFAKPGLFGGPGTGMNDGLALGIAFTLLIVLELVLRRGAAADKFPETTAS